MYQIVIGVAMIFHPGECPGRQTASQINPSVDVRGVGLAAGRQVRAVGRTVNADLAPDQPVLPSSTSCSGQFSSTGPLFHQHPHFAPDE